jgi:hypothetical protein
MTRRIIGLLVTLALSLLVAPLAATAQQAKKASLRIGILSPSKLATTSSAFVTVGESGQ